MRKIILGLVATAALAAPLALAAAPANAATTSAEGVVTVTKGDIQHAMGWNNAGWDDYLATHTNAQMGSLITTGVGNTPIPAGMWYLNGQTGTVTEEWLTNEDDWTPQLVWDPVEQTITPGTRTSSQSSDVSAQPIVNSQDKLTGFKVSATGTESWTVHTTYAWEYPTAEHQTFEKNTTIQWPDTDGINGVFVNGKAVTVTPYVAPAV